MKTTKKTKQKMAYVCLYADYLQSLAPFTDAERGRLLTAMLEYMTAGTEPEFTGNERYIWPSLRSQMDRDQEAYDARCRKNKENGAKGGRPRKGEGMETKTQDTSEETEITDGFLKKPKKPKEKENEKENKKEKENENEKDKDRERKRYAAAAGYFDSPPMEIPTAAEVIAFCREQDCHIDPFRFIDYYNATGWRLGNTPIRDWRPLVLRWNDTSQNVVTGTFC